MELTVFQKNDILPTHSPMKMEQTVF
jgi:hypothetical protein